MDKKIKQDLLARFPGLNIQPRDNAKLKEITEQHLLRQAEKKLRNRQNAARGIINEAEAQERFYENTNRKD